MKSLLKRLQSRLFALLSIRQRSQSCQAVVDHSSIPLQSVLPQASPGKVQNLLPTHKPLLASLRPGLQHCQIHDPTYLRQILEAELESDSVHPAEERGDA